MLMKVLLSLIMPIAISTIGYSDIHINKDALQEILNDYHYFSNVPGSIVSICHKEECFELTAGTADPSTQERIAPDSQVRIGSLSKTITAILIMKAQEEGRLTIYDQLGQYLPQYEKWSSVTIKQLLRMEAGLPLSIFGKDQALEIIKEFLLGQHVLHDPSSALESIKDKDFVYTPGEKSIYNNTNYLLLGLILEQVYNEKLENLIQEKIAEPLGLTKTRLDMSESRNYNMSKGFLQNHHIGIPAPLLLIIPPHLKRDDGLIDATYGFASSKAWAAGGVSSIPREMAKLIQGVLSGKVINSESIEAMKDFRAGSIVGKVVPYGLGIVKKKSPIGVIYGHGGVGLGYQNTSYYSEIEDLAVSSNDNSGPAGSDSKFMKMLENMVDGKAYQALSIPEELKNDHPHNSLHLRFLGPIAASIGYPKLGSGSEGIARDVKRFLPSQSYGSLSSKLVTNNQENYIEVTAVNSGMIEFLLDQNPDMRPISLSYFHQQTLVDALKDSDGLLRMVPSELRQSPLYSFTGYSYKDKSGKNQVCVKRLLDQKRLSVLKIASDGEQSLEHGEILRLVANLPLRNYTDHDQELIEKFGLKTCPLFPL